MKRKIAHFFYRKAAKARRKNITSSRLSVFAVSFDNQLIIKYVNGSGVEGIPDSVFSTARRPGTLELRQNPMQTSPHHYYILHKPFKMLSQFAEDSDGGRVLTALGYEFPEGIHAIGRLDNESEGLLILTTDKRITKLLFNSGKSHERTYLVKVQRKVTEKTLEKLRSGVEIRIRGGDYWTTSPCEVELINEPLDLPDIPERLMFEGEVSWLKITLREGKYRQIRKMVLAVGHKCKRLIRVSIDTLEMGDLQSGGVLEIVENEFFEKLNLTNYPLT